MEEGDYICKTCYGNLYKKNKLHASLVGGLHLTNQFIQSLLSTKHLLQVNASKVTIPKILSKYFEPYKDILISKEDLTIRIDSILEDEETNRNYIESFTVIVEDDEIEITLDDMELLVDPIQDLIDSGEELLVIPADSEVFRLNIENTELSTPLKKLLKLLENEDKLNEFDDISSIISELLLLLEKSNLKSNALSLELILRELLRDNNDIQRRPLNFEKENYTLLRLTNALIHNPSLIISLAFEKIKYVIENNIFDKASESVLDVLF